MWRRTVIYQVVLLSVFVAVLYVNTLDVPFQFDDGLNITENPYIKDLGYFTGESSLESFSREGAFWRRHLGYLSFALNYSVHGLDVRGYHVVNTAIHIVCTLLVYMLVLFVFRHGGMAGRGLEDDRASLAAFFAALIFAVHPVQTQSVTYIVQRLASMAAMFSLASLNLYAWGRTAKNGAGRWAMLVAAALMAACAMKTKENAFVVPLLAVALETVFFSGPVTVFFSGPVRKRAAYLLPVLLTLAIVPAMFVMSVGVSVDGLEEATRVRAETGRTVYLMTQARVLVTYLRLFMFPVNQNLDYDYPGGRGRA
jgi:hypothetical protein